MAEFDNTNRGQVWRNDKRETDSHPHFRGDLNVDGVEYWVSAWKRGEDANPKAPLLKFSIKRKEDSVGEIKTSESKSKEEEDLPF